MATLTRRKFTAAEYHQIARAGILGEDDRVELIEGEIVEMPPIGSRHAGRVLKLSTVLNERLSGRALVNVQNPLRLGELSEPQPDVALLRPRPDFYASAHPGPGDVLLVVEVADTTAEADREVKLPLYARHGIPEAWLVDLTADRVEVQRAPGAGGYAEVTAHGHGDVLSPLAFPDLSLTVDDLLL